MRHDTGLNSQLLSIAKTPLRRLLHCLPLAVLALPVLTALLFVAFYNTGMPLTDEWAFTKSIMALENIDKRGTEWLGEVLKIAPWRFSDHWVAVPFLIYWLLAGLTHFNSTVFIVITLATFTAQLAIYRRYIVPSTAAVLPIALVLFSPAHYMELLWGFQFTLALSIIFPMTGLLILDRVYSDDSSLLGFAKLASALTLFVLGTLSSSGGFFGLPVAAVVFWLKQGTVRSRLVGSGTFVLMSTIVYFTLMNRFSHGIKVDVPDTFHVLTALGGTIWGTPVGIFEFGPGLLSATGAVILACLVFSVARAYKTGQLPAIALPLAFALFGLLCLAAIAVRRHYLGNWHLQYALPSVCGTFACAYIVRKRDRSAFTIAAYVILYVTLSLSLVGYYRGFAEYGPSYYGYIDSIENYALRHLEEPDLPKPFPKAWEIGADLVLFLAAHEHPLLRRIPPRHFESQAVGARIFVDGVQPVDSPDRTVSLLGPNRNRMRITVALANAKGRAMVQIGDLLLPLFRLHPLHTGIAACAGTPCYAGIVLPERLPAGLHPVTVWLTD